MEARTLICEGRLVATAELADTYGYDTDAYDHLFLFRRAGGYELLVVGRTERYRDDGDLASAAARVDVTFAPNTTALADIVDARWPRMSDAWWQVLESGRHNDRELHDAWVPERMRDPQWREHSSHATDQQWLARLIPRQAMPWRSSVQQRYRLCIGTSKTFSSIAGSAERPHGSSHAGTLISLRPSSSGRGQSCGGGSTSSPS